MLDNKMASTSECAVCASRSEDLKRFALELSQLAMKLSDFAMVLAGVKEGDVKEQQQERSQSISVDKPIVTEPSVALQHAAQRMPSAVTTPSTAAPANRVPLPLRKLVVKSPQ